MSEKIFALLLRLYPAHFRSRYGEESLQLIRDRLRDESGALVRLRLLFDLLTDTVVAAPQAHRIAVRAVTPAAAAAPCPPFSLLESQSPRPAALVLAAILALSGISVFAIGLRYAGINHTSRLAAIEADAAAHRRWTDGGFLGKPSPPSPPPPPFDMLETPVANPPSTVPQPRDFGASTTPTASGRFNRRLATPLAAPGHPANNPNNEQPLTPIIMVPVLSPAEGGAPAIPVPALARQPGIAADSRPFPSHAARAEPLRKATGARSILVLNPSTERPPCPPTTSETGSNFSIKPASSAASARKSHPCSKSPRSPTASASPDAAPQR